jgi:hypothetical protein
VLDVEALDVSLPLPFHATCHAGADNLIEMRGKTVLITHHNASILHAFGLSQ